MNICGNDKTYDIIDIGSTPNTVYDFNNYLEKHYPYPHKIMTAGIEDCNNIVDLYGLKGFVKLEGNKPFPFSDKSFNFLFCNAVVEHVGSRREQKFFIHECKRIAKHVFITTPYRGFPIETHTCIPFLH